MRCVALAVRNLHPEACRAALARAQGMLAVLYMCFRCVHAPCGGRVCLYVVTVSSRLALGLLTPIKLVCVCQGVRD